MIDSLTLNDFFNNELTYSSLFVKDIKAKNPDVLQVCGMVIPVYQKSLAKVMDFLDNYEFKDVQEEIHFFKYQKPQLVCELIFHSTVFDIESRRIPVMSPIQIESYYTEEWEKIGQYFIEHINFYQYYRSGSTYMDDKYFTRGNMQITDYVKNPLLAEMSVNSTTIYDIRISKILAYERLQRFIHKRKKELIEKPELQNSHIYQIADLKWTAPKSHLVELIYGLYYNGCFNKGNANIKAITNTLEQCFGITVGDVYHIYKEIKERKINRTKFLDSLSAVLSIRMNEEDM